MNKIKRFKRTLSKLGYRTPNIFRRNKKHKVVKSKIHDTITKYGKIKDRKQAKKTHKNQQ